jgi:hypothetical protein
VFEGITGRGYQGDMALDDISVLNGPCNVGPSSKMISVIPIKEKWYHFFNVPLNEKYSIYLYNKCYCHLLSLSPYQVSLD